MPLFIPTLHMVLDNAKGPTGGQAPVAEQVLLQARVVMFEIDTQECRIFIYGFPDREVITPIVDLAQKTVDLAQIRRNLTHAGLAFKMGLPAAVVGCIHTHTYLAPVHTTGLSLSEEKHGTGMSWSVDDMNIVAGVGAGGMLEGRKRDGEAVVNEHSGAGTSPEGNEAVGGDTSGDMGLWMLGLDRERGVHGLRAGSFPSSLAAALEKLGSGFVSKWADGWQGLRTENSENSNFDPYILHGARVFLCVCGHVVEYTSMRDTPTHAWGCAHA